MNQLIAENQERQGKKSNLRFQCLPLTNLTLADFVELRTFIGYKEGWEYVMEREYKEFWKYVTAYRQKKINASDLVTRHGKFKAKMIMDCSL